MYPFHIYGQRLWTRQWEGWRKKLDAVPALKEILPEKCVQEPHDYPGRPRRWAGTVIRGGHTQTCAAIQGGLLEHGHGEGAFER